MTDLLLATLSILTALALPACGASDRDVRDHNAAAPPALATETTPSPVAAKIETKDEVCRTLNKSYNSSTAKFVANTQIYKVERQLQRVIRKDCQGQVTSDEIETVQSPRVRESLNATKRGASARHRRRSKAPTVKICC